MKMKKFAVLLLSILMISVLALTGCGGADSGEASESAESNETTLRLSVWGSDAEIACDQEVIDAFMEEFPEYKVELEVINDDYLTKVETEMLAGDAPDVIYGHPKYFMKWAKQDQLLDLTEYFKNSPELKDPEHYAVDLYDAFTYEGKDVATINGADTFLIYYNKNLFDEAGVPYPTEDWTWDDFLSACEKLTVDKDGDGTIDQYAITADWDQKKIEAYMGAFGGELFDDMNNPTEVTVNTNEGNKKGLQMMYDILFKYNYAPNAEQSEALAGSFDQGLVAMDLEGVFSIVYRSAEEGGLEFPYGLAPLPQEGENAHNVALMAGYCIPKTCKNPDAAWELAKFMESVKGQTLLAKSGLITVINKDVASSDEVIDIPNAPDNHILRVTTLDGSVNIDAKLANWQETIDTAWNPVIDQLYNGDINVDQALDALQTNLTDMLEKNNAE